MVIRGNSYRGKGIDKMKKKSNNYSAFENNKAMVWVGRKGLLLIGVVRQILNNGWTEVRYRSVPHLISGERSFRLEEVTSEKAYSRRVPGTSSSHIVGTQ